MTKVLTFAKSQLKTPTHIEEMTGFARSLATLAVNHPDYPALRDAFTAAVRKEDADYKNDRGNAMTQVIADADSARDRAYGTISTVAHTFAQPSVGSEQQTSAAKAIVAAAKKYSVNVNAQLNDETAVLQQFINEVEAKGIDLSCLSLDNVFADLKQNNDTVRTYIKERAADNAAVVNGRVKEDRLATDALYDQIVDMLNAALIFTPGAELEQFVFRWNAAINQIRVNVLRTTAGSHTDAAPESPADDTHESSTGNTPESPTDGVPGANGNTPTTGEDGGNEHDGTIEF